MRLRLEPLEERVGGGGGEILRICAAEATGTSNGHGGRRSTVGAVQWGECRTASSPPDRLLHCRHGL